VPAGRQRPDQQRLVVLVVRVEGDEAAGEVGGAVRVAAGEPGQGALVQQGRRGAPGVPALRLQPDLERRAAGEGEAGEQLGGGVEPVRLGRAGGSQLEDVDPHVAGAGEGERVARDGGGVAEEAPQHRQRPAQRGERVVGAGEEQAGDVGAAGRRPAQQQVGEQAPDLVPRRCGPGVAAGDDARGAEEVDHEIHASSPVPRGRVTRPSSGRRRSPRG
jgi:hypothetical protein